METLRVTLCKAMAVFQVLNCLASATGASGGPSIQA